MTNITLIISNLPEIQKALGNKPAKRAIKHCLQVIQKTAGVATVADLLKTPYDAKADRFTAEAMDAFLEGDVYRLAHHGIDPFPRFDPADRKVAWQVQMTIRSGVNAAFNAIDRKITSIQGGYGPDFNQDSLTMYVVERMKELSY